MDAGAEKALMVLVMKYVEFCRKGISMVLINSTQLENTLSESLGQYFFPNEPTKSAKFISLVLYETNLSFKAKIDLFLKILEQDYPNIKSKYPKIADDFEDFRKFRNIIAHSNIDKNPKTVVKNPKIIRLDYYKNGKKDKVSYTQDMVSDRLHLTTKIMKVLYEFQKEIKKSNTKT